MIEVLKFELRQMLGGKKKLFVGLLLLLPVVLTLMARLGPLSIAKARMEERVRWHESVLSEEWNYVEVRVDQPPSTWAEPELIRLDGERRIKVRGAPIPGYKVQGGMLCWDWLGGDRLLEVPPAVTRANGQTVFLYDPPRLRISTDYDFRQLGSGQHLEFESFDASGPFSWDLVTGIILFMIYPQTLCLLLAILYGASLLQTELESKTLTYLFTRPLSRSRIVWGKYLATVLALLLPFILSFSISWVLLDMPGGATLFGALLVACLFGLFCYQALFILIGMLIPTRAMVACLIYAVAIEFALSFIPALVNMFTVTYHLRSLVVLLVGYELPRDLDRIVAGRDMSMSLVALTSIAVVSMVLVGILVNRREYVVTDQV